MNPIFEKRHSTKAYLDRKVEEEKVEEVIKAGLLAPSGKNLQAPVIVCITDEDTIGRLSALNAKIGGFPENVDPFYGAKTVLLVLARKVNTAVYDGSIVLENMLLQASDMGLGACWIHRAKEEVESMEGKEILSSLGLDLDDYVGVGHVILGYAKNEPKPHDIKEGRVLYIR